jgi:hypothetical protein
VIQTVLHASVHALAGTVRHTMGSNQCARMLVVLRRTQQCMVITTACPTSSMTMIRAPSQQYARGLVKHQLLQAGPVATMVLAMPLMQLHKCKLWHK